MNTQPLTASSDVVRAFAPATVANVVCGFDVFGFAVQEPGDTVSLQWSTSPGVHITAIHGDGGLLPLEAERNTAGVAIIEFLRQAGIDRGVTMEVTKGLPLGSGMGSSAASSVAALVAINELTGCNLSRAELLPFAMEAERIACGSAHADNAAPGLLGGFVLVRSYEPLDVVSIPFPERLRCVLVHPDLELKTRDARRVLRQTLSLSDATRQWGNTAGLVAGLIKGDLGLVGRSMEDKVAEPVRSLLIPGYAQVRQAALGAGAIGCGISGSGPTMFALCEDHADSVGEAMVQAFRTVGLSGTVFHSKLNPAGAALI
ncbi:MAG: homoserine kinase [Bacteroidota bacterium]